MKKKNMSIIVYSCAKNIDMWEIFLKLFYKYWRNCPYKLLLVTDKAPKIYEKWETKFDATITIDDSWGKMIKTAINAAQTPYVSLWMDDYLLCDYVVNEKIETVIKLMEETNAANIRLIDTPIINDLSYRNRKDLGYYKAGTAYCISTQVGVWDAEFLLQVINEQWSAWEFEREGSLKIYCQDRPYLIYKDYVFPYEEGVRRGKWMDNGVRLCKRNGIALDPQIRPIMTNWELAKIYLKGAILENNPTLILKLQNIFGKLKLRVPF